MITLQTCNPFCVAMQAEHRQMHGILTSLREQLESVVPDEAAKSLPMLRQGLDGLRTRLRAHFASEEAGGCLDEAAARLPRLGEEVTQIEHEHEEILALLNRLFDQAALDLPSAEWPTFVAAYAEFEAQLRRHEAREDAVLARGFNEPLNTPS